MTCREEHTSKLLLTRRVMHVDMNAAESGDDVGVFYCDVWAPLDEMGPKPTYNVVEDRMDRNTGVVRNREGIVESDPTMSPRLSGRQAILYAADLPVPAHKRTQPSEPQTRPLARAPLRSSEP